MGERIARREAAKAAARIPVVRRACTVAAAALILPATLFASAQESNGEKNFNGLCAACHTIGGGTRVGPDLLGVTERQSEEWLISFIKSSQTVIKSGDPYAVARFAEFNNLVMPDAPYSDAEIREILAFIATGKLTAAPAQPMGTITPVDVQNGLDYFQGTRRFINAGPACNSCHHIANDAVIGGGILAKDLTSVFTRMGAPGIQAILGQPPFPVMDQAYKGRPLTEDEVFALVAFLQDADQHQALQQPRDYGVRLFYSGAGGLVVWLGLCALFGSRRKKRSVNRLIYERQVKTQ